MTRRKPLVLLLLTCVALVASRIGAYQPGTWLAEVIWVVLGVPILGATYRRMPLSDLAYLALAAFALVIVFGAHYTYARVPIGEWARDQFGFARNHYDRLGHFMQGFTPAIVLRELLIRTSKIGASRTKWRPLIVTGLCLGIAALFELFEAAWAVNFSSSGATEDLGAQGDKWDTQWDMFDALVGAIVAQVTLSKVHDRSMRKLAN